jgi:signal transduction histidine kinase
MHRLIGARPRSRLVDVAIATVALVGSLAQLSRGGIGVAHIGHGQLDWVDAVLATCSTLPLLGWRRAPRAVFLITASAAAVLAALGRPMPLALGPAVALYLLAAGRDDQDPWGGSDTAMAIALFSGYLGASALGDNGFPGSELLHTGLAWSVGWFAGERTRLRHEHIVELAQRAERNEREAERERALAIAEERARIARDLHDSAGHAINVIALRAGTARMRADPERSQAALQAIEELARRTVAEIDQAVGALRDGETANAGVEAPSGLASLDALVARQAAAGLKVTVAREGEPRPREGAVDQAAYRIVQEALTNAARHGSGGARVELAFGRTALELRITNATTADAAPRPNGGHGLIGMRERATLLGGSLDIARANGSFSIYARLPYAGPGA